MKSYNIEQSQDIDFGNGKIPRLIKDYRFNSFPNRRSRRQSAKRSGFFKRDAGGRTQWWRLRADPQSNVQTLLLTKPQTD